MPAGMLRLRDATELDLMEGMSLESMQGFGEALFNGYAPAGS